MFEYLKGTLISKTPSTIILDVNNIGYTIGVPFRDSVSLKENETYLLYIHPVFKEDSQSLYGFNSLKTRDFFKFVVEKVSGMGPKTCITLLSKFSVEELSNLIQTKDSKILSTCPGIGPKTAENIIHHLKDWSSKFVSDSPGTTATVVNLQEELENSLISLGFSKKEAQPKAKKTIKENLTVEDLSELIQIALT